MVQNKLQWDFQNKESRAGLVIVSFVLKVPLRYLRPSVIYSVPCDRILQRAYWIPAVGYPRDFHAVMASFAMFQNLGKALQMLSLKRSS